MAESHVQHKLLGMAKRRIPTLIAVITLLVVWEAWVRLGHVPSTMIAAPSEIAQATVETWPTLWPATEVTLLEGNVGNSWTLAEANSQPYGFTYRKSRRRSRVAGRERFMAEE